MNDWLEILDHQLSRGQDLVLVSVIAVRGSAPREVGARMLVTRDDSYLTIGGGNLEYRAIDIARQLLEQKVDQVEQQFSLGASLGQCCGGSVILLYERINRDQAWLEPLRKRLAAGYESMLILPLDEAHPNQRLVCTPSVGSSADSIPDLDPGTQLQLKFLGHDLLQQNRGCTLQVLTDARGRKRRFLMDPVRPMDFDIYVFGAGHVGRALVQMLRLQSCRINWIETRDDQFPSEPDRRVQKLCTDTPEAEIAQAPENSFFVIMTHDHALDLRLTEAVLKRDDFAYLGLIGSRSKRLRFEHRLRDRGYKPYQLSRITCPIGIDDIRGKEPARVALAVTAQLVQIYEALDNQAENPVKLYSSA